jgi:hypothetical protein
MQWCHEVSRGTMLNAEWTDADRSSKEHGRTNKVQNLWKFAQNSDNFSSGWLQNKDERNF